MSRFTYQPVADSGRPAGRWSRRWGLMLVAGIVLLHILGPRTGGSPDVATAVDGALSVILAFGQGLPLLWRRSRPVVVAGGVLACYGIYGVILGLEPPYAAWIATWALATSSSPRRAAKYQTAVAALVTVALIGTAELRSPGSGASGLLGAATVVVALGGWLARTERGRVDALRQAAATEERVRIARDLHDLVGHGLSAVAVQSSTARMSLDAGDYAAAGRALTAVESSSRAAMREMRGLLRLLQGTAAERSVGSADAEAASPSPGLADIATLVEQLQRSGNTVDFVANGYTDSVPAPVQLCTYRVVQEALTNAVKHAPGSRVFVEVVADKDAVRLVVENSGGESADAVVDKGGLGLAGIRARVTEAGGTARIGPTASGWRVQADVPTRSGRTDTLPRDGVKDDRLYPRFRAAR